MRFGGIAAAALVGAMLTAAPAGAQNTYTVTTSGDDASPAACTPTGGTSFSCATLRDAINASNTAGANNTIDFAPGVTTVTLATNLTTLNTQKSDLAPGGGITLNLNGNLFAVDQVGASSFPSIIAGGTTSTLALDGPGRLTLTGVNSYVGPTIVGGGTLAIGAGGAIRSSSGLDLLNSGTAFDISGGGNQTIQDLTGVAGSTISLGANTLTLGTANSTTFAGAISGTGGVAKQGAGTLTLTGANSYSGGTTVSAGTLSGNTTSLQGNIADNANVVFDQTSDGTYSGVLSGSGTLSLMGSADLVLTADSSGFAGTTQVTGGDLVVGPDSSPNARLGGSVTVQNGALVSGLGTIGGSLGNLGGTVKPGGSIGTLTVAGNYVQSSAGTLAIEFNPSAASRLAVGGSATLAGTLQLSAAAGQNYVPFTRFAILTANNGLTGTFGQVTGTLPILPLTVQYGSNEVDLVLGGFVGATINQIAVANVLNAAFPTATGGFATVLDLAVNLPTAQLQQALASFGGQIYGNLAQVSLQDRRLFLDAMGDRIRLAGGPSSPIAAGLPSGGLAGAWGSGANGMQLAAIANAVNDPLTDAVNASISGYGGGAVAPGASAGNLWARGFGQFGDLDTNNGALGSSYSTGGGAIGADLISTPQSLLGVAVSGGESSVSLNTNPESGTVSFYQIGVYGAQVLGWGFTADGAALYSHDHYDVSRGIVLPGTSRVAASKHSGDDIGLEVGIGHPYTAGGMQIVPRLGASYFHIGQGSFSESGAGALDLAVAPSALDALYSQVGIAISQPVTIGATSIIPEFRAAWLHNFMDDQSRYTASFIGGNAASFGQVGPALGRDVFDLGIGLSFAIAQADFPDRMSGFIQYNATLSSHESANAVAGGLRVKW